MKLIGTVERLDVGPGVFVLKADDGNTYQLRGADKTIRQVGKRVEVDGNVDATESAGMVGPVLNVLGFSFV